jgi:tetratricopeptide (TPR) repeat protein
MCHSDVYFFVDPSPREAEAAKETAERAASLAPELPESYLALAAYQFVVTKDDARFSEVAARGLAIAPDNEKLLSSLHTVKLRLGLWEEALGYLIRLRDLNPRSEDAEGHLGHVLLRMRRIGEARAALDRGLALQPAALILIQLKAMTYLQEGNLAAARAIYAGAPKEVEPTTLVRSVSDNLDLDWSLTDQQRDLLLRLTPSAFNDDRSDWGLVLAQAASRSKDDRKVRQYAEEARKALEGHLEKDPDHAWRRAYQGLSLAYLGRCEEAVREGGRAVALRPVAKDALSGPYIQHQLVRIHILCGNEEKALDLLEPLLKIPYILTPAWLRIDPNFDPLRKHPRFQRLVAGK